MVHREADMKAQNKVQQRSGKTARASSSESDRAAAEQVLPKSRRTSFQELLEAVAVAIVLAMLIKAFLFQAFKIPSGSMESTLLVGDHILVSKFIYGERIPFTDKRWPLFRTPQRGDIIVFVYPKDRSKDFIKRVVAVGGDTIEVRGKKVILNGKETEEPYAQFVNERMARAYGQDMPRPDRGPWKVPQGKLFVMGDNRDQSADSREWGFVPIEDVKGRACIIYYSPKQFPSRIFKLIH
jgi:signal peptidase I